MGSELSKIRYNDIVNIKDEIINDKYKHIITYSNGEEKTIILNKDKEYRFQWTFIMSKPGTVDYHNIKEIINYKKTRDVNYVKKHYETEEHAKQEKFLYEFTIVYNPKKNTKNTKNNSDKYEELKSDLELESKERVEKIIFTSYQINLFLYFVEKYSPVKLNNKEILE